MKGIASAFFAASLLCACSDQPPRKLEPVVPKAPACPSPSHPASSVEEVLRDHARVESLAGAALLDEFHAQSAKAESSETDRVRFALLLSMPGTSFRDVPKAILLLKEPIADPALAEFARLLVALLREEHRSDEASVHLAKLLHEEKKRSEMLQEKIDAITNLEKNMILRERK